MNIVFVFVLAEYKIFPFLSNLTCAGKYHDFILYPIVCEAFKRFIDCHGPSPYKVLVLMYLV